MPFRILAAFILSIALAAPPAEARKRSREVPVSSEGLVDNVNGLTLDGAGKVIRFRALSVTPDGKVGRIFATGDALPARPAWRLDGAGRTLLPGLIDAHGHVMDLGLASLSLDLSGTRSLAEAQAKIAAYAKANPERKWITGGGWNQETWRLGRMPTSAELDAAVADRPVWLSRADGHASWGNSAALKAAGVTAATKAPAGGAIDGGVFVDAAQELVAKAVPPVTAKDRDVALLKAQEVLASFGITAIADMGTSVEDWLAFRRAGDANRLQVRIVSYARGIEPINFITSGEPTPWLYGDRLRLRGVKLYADGALGSRGACLKAPYADRPDTRGLCFMTDAQLKNLMVRASMDGMQLAVHAIGDRADAQVLDAIDELAQTFTGDRRWRIEHAQVADPADLPRFGRHGTIASMQPVHQTSDRLMAEARLGSGRLGGAYAWASMLRNGGRLAFGSDVPVESANPFPGLAAAISREGPDGEPAGGWQPQERVTREQAIAGFTIGGAYAMFAEDRLGRLAPGYRADFVLVDVDPLQAPAAQLRAGKVYETWIGGTRVFKRGTP